VKALWAALAASAVVTAMPASAHATSLELYGFGARAIALAGAAEAVEEDYFAAFTNPANLAFAKKIHFGFGADAIWNRQDIQRVAGQSQYPNVMPVDNYLAHIGISTPLGGIFRDKLALGIAVHVPLGGPTRLDAHDYRQPQLPLFDTLGDRLALVAGLAYRPWPWLSIGAGVQVLTALTGRADIALSVLDHRITQKAMDVELSTEAYPILGVTLQPRDDWRIAAVWRKSSQVSYAIPLAVDMQDVGHLNFNIQGIGLWLPDTFVLAAAHRMGQLNLTGGVAWLRFSQMPPLAPDVTVVIDDAALKQGGAQPDKIIDVHNVAVALGAKDILEPRLGAEWQIHDNWVLRGGLQYRPTPFPRADGAANYLDAAATTVALGAGAVLGEASELAKRPLHIDLALAATVLSRRTVAKLDPGDPVQATSVSGTAWHLALTVHHDF
jgi:long-chain fatty acid transport protein